MPGRPVELAPLRRADYDPARNRSLLPGRLQAFRCHSQVDCAIACTLSASTDLLTAKSRSMSAMTGAADATVKEALRKRVDFPVEQGFARWDGDRVKVRLALLPTLRQRELDGVCDGAR